LGITYERLGEEFDDLFRPVNHNVAHTAQQNLCGLMRAQKRNMERVEYSGGVVSWVWLAACV
jgi:hypothetical protein